MHDSASSHSAPARSANQPSPPAFLPGSLSTVEKLERLSFKTRRAPGSTRSK